MNTLVMLLLIVAAVEVAERHRRRGLRVRWDVPVPCLSYRRAMTCYRNN